MSLNPWTSSLPASRANPPASPGSDKGNLMPDGSGPIPLDCLAYYDPDSSCWKTPQASLALDADQPSETFSETWPASGTMQNGRVFPQLPLVPRTSATGYSSWPTPDANDWRMEGLECSKRRWERYSTMSLNSAVKLWPTPQAQDTHRSPEAYLAMRHDRMNRNTVTSLSVAAQMFPTPAARDYRSGKSSDAPRDQLNEVIGGTLNADWVSILMGLPAEWTVVDGSAASPESPHSSRTESND